MKLSSWRRWVRTEKKHTTSAMSSSTGTAKPLTSANDQSSRPQARRAASRRGAEISVPTYLPSSQLRSCTASRPDPQPTSTTVLPGSRPYCLRRSASIIPNASKCSSTRESRWLWRLREHRRRRATHRCVRCRPGDFVRSDPHRRDHRGSCCRSVDLDGDEVGSHPWLLRKYSSDQPARQPMQRRHRVESCSLQ